jgi:hypothetical protein
VATCFWIVFDTIAMVSRPEAYGYFLPSVPSCWSLIPYSAVAALGEFSIAAALLPGTSGPAEQTFKLSYQRVHRKKS